MTKNTETIPLEFLFKGDNFQRGAEMLFLYENHHAIDLQVKRIILEELIRNARENVERKGGDLGEEIKGRVRAAMSLAGANAKHKRHRECRDAIEEWLDANLDAYPSMKAAARAAELDVPEAKTLKDEGKLEHDTIYRWACEWNKDRNK